MHLLLGVVGRAAMLTVTSSRLLESGAATTYMRSAEDTACGGQILRRRWRAQFFHPEEIWSASLV